MQKIMFNNYYGLTQSVLDRYKTSTRRLSTFTLQEMDENWELIDVYLDSIYKDGDEWKFKYKGVVYPLPKENYPRYSIGEVIAIAQSYKDAGLAPDTLVPNVKGVMIEACKHKGWTNKIFVRADLMPHQIRITNVRAERLQDINDEDCLAEGIEFDCKAKSYYCCFNPSTGSKKWLGNTPRKAFAVLIDMVSGKGTWESNPFVFVYDFELIK